MVLGRPPRGGRGLKLGQPSHLTMLFGRPPRGGRGLKHDHLEKLSEMHKSPPTRGAWIETPKRYWQSKRRTCRPPRGGRGLKQLLRPDSGNADCVAPHAGGVD